jgi:hypothetical protein
MNTTTDNEPTTAFGLKGVTHHLTSYKLDKIEKEIRKIEKARKKEKEAFDLSRLIDCLETFLRAEFKDEPDPLGLARWFARQYEHFEIEGCDIKTGRFRPPGAKLLRKKAAAPCKN